MSLSAKTARSSDVRKPLILDAHDEKSRVPDSPGPDCYALPFHGTHTCTTSQPASLSTPHNLQGVLTGTGLVVTFALVSVLGARFVSAQRRSAPATIHDDPRWQVKERPNPFALTA